MKKARRQTPRVREPSPPKASTHGDRSRASKPINLYAAKTRLSELVDRAAAGEEIVIAKAGRPMARLAPLQPALVRGGYGQWKGQVWMAPDFNAPLSGADLALFEGEDRESER